MKRFVAFFLVFNLAQAYSFLPIEATVLDSVREQCITADHELTQLNRGLGYVFGAAVGGTSYWIAQAYVPLAAKEYPKSMTMGSVGLVALVAVIAQKLFIASSKPEIMADSLTREEKKLLHVIQTQTGKERNWEALAVCSMNTKPFQQVLDATKNIIETLERIQSVLFITSKYQDVRFDELKKEISDALLDCKAFEKEFKNGSGVRKLDFLIIPTEEKKSKFRSFDLW